MHLMIVKNRARNQTMDGKSPSSSNRDIDGLLLLLIWTVHKLIALMNSKGNIGASILCKEA